MNIVEELSEIMWILERGSAHQKPRAKFSVVMRANVFFSICSILGIKHDKMKMRINRKNYKVVLDGRIFQKKKNDGYDSEILIVRE